MDWKDIFLLPFNIAKQNTKGASDILFMRRNCKVFGSESKDPGSLESDHKKKIAEEMKKRI